MQVPFEIHHLLLDCTSPSAGVSAPPPWTSSPLKFHQLLPLTPSPLSPASSSYFSSLMSWSLRWHAAVGLHHHLPNKDRSCSQWGGASKGLEWHKQKHSHRYIWQHFWGAKIMYFSKCTIPPTEMSAILQSSTCLGETHSNYASRWGS